MQHLQVLSTRSRVLHAATATRATCLANFLTTSRSAYFDRPTLLGRSLPLPFARHFTCISPTLSLPFLLLLLLPLAAAFSAGVSFYVFLSPSPALNHTLLLSLLSLSLSLRFSLLLSHSVSSTLPLPFALLCLAFCLCAFCLQLLPFALHTFVRSAASLPFAIWRCILLCARLIAVSTTKLQNKNRCQMP